jgi:hypothetical protein
MNYINNHFTSKQKTNYKFLRFLFNSAFWIFLFSLIPAFIAGSIIYAIIGLMIWFVFRIQSNRCVNCLKWNSLDEIDSRSVNHSDYNLKSGGIMMVLYKKHLKCKKCQNEFYLLEEKTGSFDGIAKAKRKKYNDRFNSPERSKPQSSKRI